MTNISCQPRPLTHELWAIWGVMGHMGSYGELWAIWGTCSNNRNTTFNIAQPDTKKYGRGKEKGGEGEGEVDREDEVWIKRERE